MGAVFVPAAELLAANKAVESSKLSARSCDKHLRGHVSSYSSMYSEKVLHLDIYSI